MNIKVICIGKLKEKYWVDAVAEYSKRLTPYCCLEIVELKESRLKQNAGPAEEEEVKVNKAGYFSAKLSVPNGLEEGLYGVTIFVDGSRIMEIKAEFNIKE